MDKPAVTFAEISRRMLVPAVTGGALQIGRPFGPKRAKAAASIADQEGGSAEAELREVLGPGALEGADAAVLLRLRRITASDVGSIGPRMDAGVIELAALFHDIVAVFHPDLVGIIGGSRPRKLLESTANALACVAPPATVRGAVLRHAWLGELPRFSLTRTEVRWWTGSWRSVGREPPARLLAWPEVRRVRRNDRSIDLVRLPELFADRKDIGQLGEIFTRAMSAFFQATPLSDLVFAGRMSPPFQWTPTIEGFVSTRAGARIARRAISLGEEKGKFALEALGNLGGPATRVLQ